MNNIVHPEPDEFPIVWQDCCKFSDGNLYVINVEHDRERSSFNFLAQELESGRQFEIQLPMVEFDALFRTSPLQTTEDVCHAAIARLEVHATMDNLLFLESNRSADSAIQNDKYERGNVVWWGRLQPFNPGRPRLRRRFMADDIKDRLSESRENASNEKHLYWRMQFLTELREKIRLEQRKVEGLRRKINEQKKSLVNGVRQSSSLTTLSSNVENPRSNGNSKIELSNSKAMQALDDYVRTIPMRCRGSKSHFGRLSTGAVAMPRKFRRMSTGTLDLDGDQAVAVTFLGEFEQEYQTN